MDIASCSLPFFTICYRRRAEEKRLAIDAPELLGDHTDCTCGFLFSPLWQFNCIFDINWSKGHCECALGCHIDFREGFFPPSLNLSRRAAVNSPRQQGGKLGGTGVTAAGAGVRYHELPCNILQESEEELLRTTRSLCFHRNDSICHTVYLTSQPKGEDSMVINWIVVPAEIGSLIDNHRKGHCSSNSGRKIIMLKWIVFSQLSLCLEAHTVKQNRKQIKNSAGYSPGLVRQRD